MADTWRFLDLGRLSPLDALAIPEGLLTGVAAGQPDTLAVWVASEPFVSIGREQEARTACDLEYCKDHRIPVLRRTSGGEALYVDPHRVFYAVVHRLEEGELGDGTGLFESWLEPIIDTCRDFEVDVRFQPYAFLYRGRYEIGGAHAVVRDGVLLLTAHLAVNVSETTAKEALGIREGDERDHPLTSLRHEYEGHAPPELLEIRNALARSFRKGKEITFQEGDLITPELLAANEVRQRLEDEAWLYRVDRAVDAVRATPEEGGLRVWRNHRATEGCRLDLTLVTEGGATIRDLKISGTPLFLQEEGLTQVENYLRGCYLNPATVGERILDLYDKLGLVSPGTNAADFLILIGDTIDKMSP